MAGRFRLHGKGQQPGGWWPVVGGSGGRCAALIVFRGGSKQESLLRPGSNGPDKQRLAYCLLGLTRLVSTIMEPS